MKKIIKILLIGNGPYVNRGCEAIVRGTSKFLRLNNINGKIDNAYLYANPKDILEVNIKNVSNIYINPYPKYNRFVRKFIRVMPKFSNMTIIKNNFRKLIPLIKKADIILSVGGDNYSMDYGYPIHHIQLNELVKHYKKRYFIWGSSIGPFDMNRKDAQNIVKSLDSSVNRFFVREFITYANLKKYGVEENKISFLLDPAFYMKTKAVIDKELQTYLAGNVIGVNFSPIMKRFAKDNSFDWKETAINIVQTILDKTDKKIILIPHVNKVGNSDFNFMKSLKLESTRVKLIGTDYTAEELKWIISQCDLFIGCRTHSTIAAFSTNTPTISIGYSVKAKGINQLLFDSEGYLIGIDEFSIKKFEEMVQNILVKKDEVRNQLKKRIEEFKKKDSDTFQQLIEDGLFN